MKDEVMKWFPGEPPKYLRGEWQFPDSNFLPYEPEVIKGPEPVTKKEKE